MSTSTKKVLCIFCDQRGPRAREDIITDWMSKELNPTGTVFTDFFTEVPGQPIRKRTKKSADLRTIKLPQVCFRCNGGWMSRLEVCTRPLLRRLFRGDHLVLNVAQQRQLAAWGQLKCLTLDAYYLNEYEGIRHLPAHLSHTFYQSHQPIENSLVVLGRYVAPREGVLIPWGRYMKHYPAEAEHPDISMVIATFAFRYLLIQILIGAWGSPCTSGIAFPFRDSRFRQCWPLNFNQDLAWPPPVSVTAAEFPLVAGPDTRLGGTHSALRGNLPGIRT